MRIMNFESQSELSNKYKIIVGHNPVLYHLTDQYRKFTEACDSAPSWRNVFTSSSL